MKMSESYINEQKEGTKTGLLGELSGVLATLQSLWSAITKEPRVSTSRGYLLAVRSWAIYIMSLLSTFSLIEMEMEIFICRVFIRIN